MRLAKACGALAALGVVVSAPLASAASLAFVPVRAGDVLDLVGTRVACAVQKEGVLCFHIRAEKPIVGTFGVALHIDRRTVLFRVGAGGEPKVVACRPQLAAAAARLVKLRVGQAVRLRGTRLDCAAVASAGRPTLYCSYDDAVGPIPGTHAILINDTLAAIGRVENSRRTTIVVLRRQP